MNWKVQVFGDIDSEEDREEGEIEISVIRESNKHGQDSWGWGDEDKIILPEMNPGTKEQYVLLFSMATLMARAFNETGI